MSMMCYCTKTRACLSGILFLRGNAFHILCVVSCADILYDSRSPAMTISSVCISILSMLSSCTLKVRHYRMG